MTALQAAQADSDRDFIERVSFFIVKAAIAVAAELESVPRHQSRLVLARSILANANAQAPRFALAVMTNGTLLATASLDQITDGDLEFVVNSIFTAMA